MSIYSFGIYIEGMYEMSSYWRFFVGEKEDKVKEVKKSLKKEYPDSYFTSVMENNENITELHIGDRIEVEAEGNRVPI